MESGKPQGVHEALHICLSNMLPEGILNLHSEFTFRFTGSLQFASISGASWYRVCVHPKAFWICKPYRSPFLMRSSDMWRDKR
jgi:hypothetical protein